jgi:hypothetical protein
MEWVTTGKERTHGRSRMGHDEEYIRRGFGRVVVTSVFSRYTMSFIVIHNITFAFGTSPLRYLVAPAHTHNTWVVLRCCFLACTLIIRSTTHLFG